MITKSRECPLVSVCIPSYNSESTIRETLDSVLAQDYPRLDIIVSDNQSTDKTRTIVEAYAREGVRYCFHQAGRPAWAEKMPSFIGVFANWDFALSQAKGDFLCLFHSDDLYHPNIVSSEIDVMLAAPNVGAVFTQMEMIGDASHTIRMQPLPVPSKSKGIEIFNFGRLLDAIIANSNFLPTPSVMLRRSALGGIGGFNERFFLTSADLEMWLRIAQNGHDIARVNRKLLRYRISERQFSAQYNKLRTTPTDIFKVLDYFLKEKNGTQWANKRSLRQYEVRRSVDYISCSVNLLVLKRNSEARSLLIRSMRPGVLATAAYSPRRVMQMILGALLLVVTYVGFARLLAETAKRSFRAYARLRLIPV